MNFIKLFLTKILGQWEPYQGITVHGWQLWSLYESLTFPHLVPWDSCTASTATPPSQTRASRRGRHFFLRSSQEIFSSRCLEMCHIPFPNCHGLWKSEFLSLRTSSANRTNGNCWAGQLHCLLFSVRKHSHFTVVLTCSLPTECETVRWFLFFFFVLGLLNASYASLHMAHQKIGKLLCIKDKRNKGSVWEARGRQGQLDVLFSGSSGLSEDGKRNFQKCLLIS